MQLLKALVIGMGVLIVLGMGLLAYGLLTKTRGPSSDSVQSDGPAPENTAGFGELALDGNTGCQIASTEAEGRRLIITLTASSSAATTALDCEKVVIVDMSAGTIIGSVSLQP